MKSKPISISQLTVAVQDLGSVNLDFVAELADDVTKSTAKLLLEIQPPVLERGEDGSYQVVANIATLLLAKARLPDNYKVRALIVGDSDDADQIKALRLIQPLLAYPGRGIYERGVKDAIDSKRINKLGRDSSDLDFWLKKLNLWGFKRTYDKSEASTDDSASSRTEDKAAENAEDGPDDKSDSSVRNIGGGKSQQRMLDQPGLFEEKLGDESESLSSDHSEDGTPDGEAV